jgi:hypothetical protein
MVEKTRIFYKDFAEKKKKGCKKVPVHFVKNKKKPIIRVLNLEGPSRGVKVKFIIGWNTRLGPRRSKPRRESLIYY